MSKASDIQDKLNSFVETNLPGYAKLPDAYDSQDNPMIILDKGYSVAFGAATNNQDNFCKGDIRILRTYEVILTNAYTPGVNTNYRESLEQSLMDDQTVLIGAIECDPTLTGSCVSIEYSDDGGIEYITAGNKQFISLVMAFSVDYIEGV